MSNTESEESSHDVVQTLAISAVELGDAEKDEGERHGIQEVRVAADRDCVGIGIERLGWLEVKRRETAFGVQAGNRMRGQGGGYACRGEDQAWACRLAWWRLSLSGNC
jgi:hypothetical protein